ncbi:hypothetical protein JZ751_029238 [Albula glossodonta]|uniref:Uncharacterized protein n=1 Tax=Albula glossodonta TaxID=121402 RepID=A0A8T2PCI3_9TELE|nr:hypothetical protein JZ751_029238 [Albula glossodonta]
MWAVWSQSLDFTSDELRDRMQDIKKIITAFNSKTRLSSGLGGILQGVRARSQNDFRLMSPQHWSSYQLHVRSRRGPWCLTCPVNAEGRGRKGEHGTCDNLKRKTEVAEQRGEGRGHHLCTEALEPPTASFPRLPPLL